MMVDQSCECQSSRSLCRLQISIPFEDAWVIKMRGAIIIVDGCKRGPEPTDILIEHCDGYSLYREAKKGEQ